MIHVTIRERDASAKATEPITSGSVGLPVRFRFSADWDGLGRIAVFCGSGQTVDMAIKENECVVPHEVLRHFGGRLKIGVYGTGENGSRVTPTVWANAGVILQGAEPAGVEPGAATENLVQQLLEAARSAEELAQSVRNEADAGAFIGPPGPKGDKGDPGPAGDAAVFMASYGSTAASEIESALDAGMAVFLNYYSLTYSLVDTTGSTDGSMIHHFALPIVSSGNTYVSYEITLTGSTWSRPMQRKIARTDSPVFTGAPQAPTATAGTNNTQIATTAFVQQALGGIAGGVFWAAYGMTRLAEIIAANAAGKTVMLMLGTRIYMLCDCQSGGAVFSSVRSGGTVYYVSVSPSDSWSNTSLWLVPVEQMLATTGDPGDLQTSAKNSLVAAINELNQRISGLLPASGVSF